MRKVLILLVLVGFVSLGVGYYMYNMPPKNLTNVKAEATVTSVALMSSFEEDEESANASFLGKVIEVSGLISELKFYENGSAQVNLESQNVMGGISCNFESHDAAKLDGDLRAGQQLKIKGMCTGFLMDVVLERCVLVELIEN